MAPESGDMENKLISRLQDAVHSAELIRQWTVSVDRDALESDRTLRPAIEHNLVVIGEALRVANTYDSRLDTELPHLHEWIRYGNHVLTEYREIDPDILWRRTTVEIPILIRDLERIIQSNS